nr:reverse transcriptase domain-containing protein [Tanacetum cinerariifolium]
MSREEEEKFMQTFRRTCFYNDYRDRDLNRDNWRSSGRNDYIRDYYQSNSDDKPDLQKQLSNFIKAQHSTNTFVKETFMDLKNKLETATKNHQASIQNLEAKFDQLTDKHYARPSRSLPSNTQPNPRDNPLKAYQLSQARNEHLNAVSTRSGKSYDPPTNPNDLQNDSQNSINFYSDDEDEESTSQPKSKTLKPIKEAPTPKPYKPRISYPQRLRKKKMEAQYGKFLDMSRVVRINVPLVDVLAGMTNYGKFLKELISNKKTFPTHHRRSNSVKQKQLNLGVGSEQMTFSIDFAMKHSYSNDDTCISIDVIDEILEEDFDALLDEGSKILYSIEGTPLEDKLFAEFDEFIAINIEENTKFESNEEMPFKKSPSILIIKSRNLLMKVLRTLNSNLFLITENTHSWKNPLFFLRSYHLSFQNKTKIKSSLFSKDKSKPLLGVPQAFLVSVCASVNIKFNF